MRSTSVWSLSQGKRQPVPMCRDVLKCSVVLMRASLGSQSLLLEQPPTLPCSSLLSLPALGMRVRADFLLCRSGQCSWSLYGFFTSKHSSFTRFVVIVCSRLRSFF